MYCHVYMCMTWHPSELRTMYRTEYAALSQAVLKWKKTSACAGALHCLFAANQPE